MQKRTITIIALLTSILLVILLIIKTTYSLIIDVTERDNKYELVNQITIKDLVTDDYGAYNNYYYNVVAKLNITNEEANTLINSYELNNTLNILLKNVIDNRYNHKPRLTNNEIISMITRAVNNENLISNELKEKLIHKTHEYIDDIVDYLYAIKTNYTKWKRRIIKQ